MSSNEKPWPTTKLGDLFEISSSKRVLQNDWKGEGVPFYRAREIVRLANAGSVENELFISEAHFSSLAEKFGAPEPGDIMVSAVGTLGACYVVKEGDRFYFKDASVLRLRPKHSLCARYFWHVFQTQDLKSQINATSGSTVGTLTIARAQGLDVPLPPLDEQKRIAAILDKADALRAKRRQVIALRDSLSQSIFLEMFGDPVSNPKGWEVKSLAEFELFLTSGSRGWAEYYSEQGTPFIRIQNLKGGRLSTEDLVLVNAPENAEARRTRVESGDVLISITADLGRVAVVPAHVHQAANINQHIALFRPKGINPTFLSSYLASQGGKRQFAALNRQGVKAGLNFSDIRALKILNPPMEMQHKFEKLAKLVADREISLSDSSEGTEALFTSLQHRAFSGQL